MTNETYRGASIEQENDKTYSIYFVGNPYATTSGFETIEDAKKHVDWIKGGQPYRK